VSLIDINIPEEEGWQDTLASRVLALILAALLMRAGLRLWGAAIDNGVTAAVLTALTFAVGVQIAVLCASDIDFEAHSRKIAYGSVTALTLLAVGLAYETGAFPKLGSDVIAFTSYASELVAEGTNPFAASMAPSAELPGHPDRWTRRADGSKVVDWSYPGGTLWLYTTQYVTIGRSPFGIRLTSIIGVGLLAVAMIRWLPREYAALAPISLLAAQNEFMAAVGGLNDMWWVLPTGGALVLWARDRRVWAAAVLGVACAMKQQPWPIALFLAIWVWRERESFEDFARTGGTYAAVGLGTFTLLNLPWLLADPAAWVGSVLVPVAGDTSPLVSTGVGIAALNTAADGLIPRSTFDLLIPATISVAALGYWYYFEKIRWAAWLAPPVILYFAPRSLPSYFHWFVPIAVLALFARFGRLEGQRREVLA
jgi:uncharacterized membrane protein